MQILSLVIFSIFFQPGNTVIEFPEYKGWDLSTNFPVYTPEDLWDYINGAADGFVSYGLMDMRMAEYTKSRYRIKAEIYHHKDPNNAYGIYASERSSDYSFLDLGVQGYQTGTSLNFLTGEYYIKLECNSEKPRVINTMKEIAILLAENTGTVSDYPPVFDLFPEEGKIPNTEHFISKNFLGHSFFNEVFTISYQKEDQSFTLFLTEKSSSQECYELLKTWHEYNGHKDISIDQGEQIIEDKYNGQISLIWKDRIIFGVINTMDSAIRDQYLQKTNHILSNQ